MTTIGHIRGWLIYWNEDKKAWFYIDNDQSIDNKRKCYHCGLKPTPEGYDACTGYIENALSVCCGHGKEKNKILKLKEKDNGNV